MKAHSIQRDGINEWKEKMVTMFVSSSFFLYSFSVLTDFTQSSFPSLFTVAHTLAHTHTRTHAASYRWAQSHHIHSFSDSYKRFFPFHFDIRLCDGKIKASSLLHFGDKQFSVDLFFPSQKFDGCQETCIVFFQWGSETTKIIYLACFDGIISHYLSSTPWLSVGTKGDKIVSQSSNCAELNIPCLINKLQSNVANSLMELYY